MNKPTKKQQRNMIRIGEMADEGPAVFLKHLSEAEDRIDEELGIIDKKFHVIISSVDNKASEAVKIASETQKMQGQRGERGEKGDRGNDGSDGMDGKEGKPGRDGRDGRNGVNGIDGRDGEKGAPGDIKNISPQEIRDLLELLHEEERIDAKAIKNLPELIRKLNPSNGPMLHTPSIGNLPDVSIAGILSGQTIQWDGVKFVAANAGGSSGFQQPLTGGLTGTNTWTTAPNVIVIDNIPRQKVQTDGTVMWTGTTTTVLTNAPLPQFDIFSSS